jgi:hypothetical protein
MANTRKLERERQAALGSPGVEVVLGDYEYHVVPQRIGYLRSNFGLALQGLDTAQLSSGNIMDFLGERVYAVLRVFIPNLMPRHEFLGFKDVEAEEKDEYDPEFDNSPSPTQIKEALLQAAEVNEIDLLKHLGKLIGPELIQTWAQTVMIDSMKASLQTSVEPNGDTPGTTSGLSSPTSG